jgi:hypothetical protein
MVRWKKHSPEQIEVEIANGKTTPQACKEAEQTYDLPYGTHVDDFDRENSEVKLDPLQ